jgi:hypothetical protein
MSLECTNESDLSDIDKRNLVVVLMQGQDRYYCYSRAFFREVITGELSKKLYEYKKEVLNRSSPVLKEPYFGVFMNKSVIAFQHFDCLLLYAPELIPLHKEGAIDEIGAYHGQSEPVYSVFPVSLSLFLNRGRESVRDFTSRVIASLDREILARDVDRILRGGDFDFIGRTYRRFIRSDINRGLEGVRDYHAEEMARREEEERAERARAPIRPANIVQRFVRQTDDDFVGPLTRDIQGEIEADRARRRRQVRIDQEVLDVANGIDPARRIVDEILNEFYTIQPAYDNFQEFENSSIEVLNVRPTVELLMLSNCPNVTRIPYVRDLRKLDIINCDRLVEIDERNRPESLALYNQPNTDMFVRAWCNKVDRLFVQDAYISRIESTTIVDLQLKKIRDLQYVICPNLKYFLANECSLHSVDCSSVELVYINGGRIEHLEGLRSTARGVVINTTLSEVGGLSIPDGTRPERVKELVQNAFPDIYYVIEEANREEVDMEVEEPVREDDNREQAHDERRYISRMEDEFDQVWPRTDSEIEIDKNQNAIIPIPDGTVKVSLFKCPNITRIPYVQGLEMVSIEKCKKLERIDQANELSFMELTEMGSRGKKLVSNWGNRLKMLVMYHCELDSLNSASLINLDLTQTIIENEAIRCPQLRSLKLTDVVVKTIDCPQVNMLYLHGCEVREITGLAGDCRGVIIQSGIARIGDLNLENLTDWDTKRLIENAYPGIMFIVSGAVEEEVEEEVEEVEMEDVQARQARQAFIDSIEEEVEREEAVIFPEDRHIVNSSSSEITINRVLTYPAVEVANSRATRIGYIEGMETLELVMSKSITEIDARNRLQTLSLMTMKDATSLLLAQWANRLTNLNIHKWRGLELASITLQHLHLREVKISVAIRCPALRVLYIANSEVPVIDCPALELFSIKNSKVTEIREIREGCKGNLLNVEPAQVGTVMLAGIVSTPREAQVLIERAYPNIRFII